MPKKTFQLNTFGFALFFLLNFQAHAENLQLKANYYLRSSMDFLSKTNKIGILQEGSTFRVINRFPRRNGAEALEIEITGMSRGSYVNPSATDKIFIYKPAQTSDFLFRSGERVEAGVSKCENCESEINENSAVVLKHISDTVTEIQNIAPQAEIKVEQVETIVATSEPLQSGKLDEQIKNYSESREVSRMIDWAMKNKSASSKGICYRKVKEALATQCGPPRHSYICKNPFAPEGGKKGPGNNLTSSVSTEWADSYALSAKNRLKEQGFVNLLEIDPYKSQMRTARAAPKGAVLVYSSGIPCNKQSDCGHAEIKVGNPGEDGYVSDYYSKDAVNDTPRARKYGSNYKLVGIMIKPKDQK